jgi:steroid 5-alpha reductase family enzyme
MLTNLSVGQKQLVSSSPHLRNGTFSSLQIKLNRGTLRPNQPRKSSSAITITTKTRSPAAALSSTVSTQIATSFMGLDTQAATLVGAFIVDFGIQIAGWALAVALKSEKFYDLLGTVAYLAVALGSLAYGGFYYTRQVVMTTMVCVWTLRLGSFLVLRVIKTGGDSRFDTLKHQPLNFLVAWVLQGVWVWIVSLPLMLLNSSSNNPELGAWSDILGQILWAIGFLVETTADFQKLAFKSNPANKGKFINTGLWKYARFPNYFGEICLWIGVWLGCCATFTGGEWASIASPLFVAFLLLFVSGVPLQERQAQERWGSDPAYVAHRQNTNLLVPIPIPAALRRNRSAPE